MLLHSTVYCFVYPLYGVDHSLCAKHISYMLYIYTIPLICGMTTCHKTTIPLIWCCDESSHHPIPLILCCHESSDRSSGGYQSTIHLCTVCPSGALWTPTCAVSRLAGLVRLGTWCRPCCISRADACWVTAHTGYSLRPHAPHECTVVWLILATPPCYHPDDESIVTTNRTQRTRYHSNRVPNHRTMDV